jgi:hypothetical protein
MRTIAILAILAAGPVAADELIFFQAPSGNIHCMIATGTYAEARCDIFEGTLSYPVQPADCDLDWGHAFSVGPSGPGAPACAGDTVAQGGSLVLQYGSSVTQGVFTCMSERSGMTCLNREGHGFTLARAAQKVF